MGQYKLKVCPTCNKEHRKRGPYCSQGCHNRVREISDKIRENARKVGANNAGNPALIAQGHMLQRGQYMTPDEYAVDIPNIPDIELPDGYDRGENW